MFGEVSVGGSINNIIFKSFYLHNFKSSGSDFVNIAGAFDVMLFEMFFLNFQQVTSMPWTLFSMVIEPQLAL